MDMSRTRSFIMLNKILCRCKEYNPSTIHFRRQGQISPQCREFKFRFKLLIFSLLQWPPFRRINILLQTLPTPPSSCHWSRQCCARLGFLLGMRLATVSHRKKVAIQTRERTLYQSWLPRDLSQPSNNSHFGCKHGTCNIEKGAQGSWEPYYSFSRWLEFGIFVLSLLEIDCTLKWRWMFGICKSWMIVWCWGIQACKLLV